MRKIVFRIFREKTIKTRGFNKIETYKQKAID